LLLIHFESCSLCFLVFAGHCGVLTLGFEAEQDAL